MKTRKGFTGGLQGSTEVVSGVDGCCSEVRCGIPLYVQTHSLRPWRNFNSFRRSYYSTGGAWFVCRRSSRSWSRNQDLSLPRPTGNSCPSWAPFPPVSGPILLVSPTSYSETLDLLSHSFPDSSSSEIYASFQTPDLEWTPRTTTPSLVRVTVSDPPSTVPTSV